jgi:hypothetical protein
MIELSFKVRETTKRGKQLKTPLSKDAFDKPIPLGNPVSHVQMMLIPKKR